MIDLAKSIAFLSRQNGTSFAEELALYVRALGAAAQATSLDHLESEGWQVVSARRNRGSEPEIWVTLEKGVRRGELRPDGILVSARGQRGEERTMAPDLSPCPPRRPIGPSTRDACLVAIAGEILR